MMPISLAMRATIPNWANGVNNEFGGELIAARELGVACLAAAEQTTLVNQLGTSGAMDRAVYAAAA